MKKIFFIAVLAVLVSACGNQSKTDGKSENTVSDELVSNPATADNPTAKTDKYAIMTFKTKEHNFGDILENQKVETTFEFTNTGKVDLLINDCQASCGCTVPEWPRTPIKPGESGKIKVKFDSSGRSGLNTKVVTVLANIQEEKIELQFKANVLPLNQTNE